MASKECGPPPASGAPGRRRCPGRSRGPSLAACGLAALGRELAGRGPQPGEGDGGRLGQLRYPEVACAPAGQLVVTASAWASMNRPRSARPVLGLGGGRALFRRPLPGPGRRRQRPAACPAAAGQRLPGAGQVARAPPGALAAAGGAVGGPGRVIAPPRRMPAAARGRRRRGGAPERLLETDGRRVQHQLPPDGQLGPWTGAGQVGRGRQRARVSRGQLVDQVHGQRVAGLDGDAEQHRRAVPPPGPPAGQAGTAPCPARSPGPASGPAGAARRPRCGSR